MQAKTFQAETQGTSVQLFANSLLVIIIEKDWKWTCKWIFETQFSQTFVESAWANSYHHSVGMH